MCVLLDWVDALSQVGGSVHDVMINLGAMPPPCYPATLQFHRRVLGNQVLSWCPIFSVMNYSAIVLDMMHTIDLGVAAYYAGLVFMLVLKYDLFTTGATSMDLRIQHGIMNMSKQLELFYDMPANKRASKVGELTRHVLLGNHELDRPIATAKAMETRGLAYFAMHLLNHFEEKCHAGPEVLREASTLLRRAGDELKTFYHLMNTNRRHISDAHCDICTTCVVNHNTRYRMAGALLGIHNPLVPKHHLWWEMARDLRFRGNARYYATFVDESLNLTFSETSKSVHARRFAESVLGKWFLLCMADNRFY